jgi:hypothetical protein
MLSSLVGLFSPFLLNAQDRVDSLSFDTIDCGATACETVQVRSTFSNEQIIAIIGPASPFSVGPSVSLPIAIPDNDSVELEVCFAPASRGDYSGALQLVISSEETIDTETVERIDTVELELAGSAVGPALFLPDNPTFFPETAVGSSNVKTILIVNVGESEQDVQLSSLSGIIEPFSLVDSTGFPATIAPGDTLKLEVMFAPTQSGYWTAYTDIPSGCGQSVRLELRGRTPALLENGYGQVPCGESVCDTVWVPWQSDGDRIVSIRMRDSTSFIVGDTPPLPIALPVDDSVGIPVCFVPSRRGNIIDSVSIVVERNGQDVPIRIRLTGTGIGPNVQIDPIVLNFPKTTPPATSTQSTWFRNAGERPYLLTAADLPTTAPFSVITQLPIEILPGDSVEIVFEFGPTDRGIFSQPVDVTVGCNRVLQLGLNGSTDFIGTGGVLRVTKVGFNPANNERVACDVSKCTDVTITNVGNAALRIENLEWEDGSLGYTFNPAPAVPFTVNPNEQRVLTVCIDASRAGTLSDTLIITSNDRRSIAFGIVFDASRSMVIDSIRCGPNTYTRLAEAKTQSKLFVDNTLLNIPSLGIQDQLAITHFSSELISNFPRRFRPVINTSFELQFIDDPKRQEAKDALDAIVEIGGTFTGAAVRDMVQRLQASPLEDRVIVLVADGETDDNEPDLNPLSTVIAEAKAAGIRIFPIGIALDEQNAFSYMNDLADETNGKAFFVEDCSSLEDAFAEITEIVSAGGKWREPFEITVTAPRVIADKALFDSTYIDHDTCLAVTLTNVGEGEAIVTDVEVTDMLGNATGEFYLDTEATSFPITIQENGQKQVTVCFKPDSLRQRKGLMRAIYNSCNDVRESGEIEGTGYAIANLRVSDTMLALPGDIITMPVYGDSSLVRYDVDSILFTVQWNRTMLELKEVRPGAAANGASVISVGPVMQNGRFATVQIRADGPALYNPGELAQIDFEFLRGDTLASPVEVTTATFADGNPKTLLKNPGLVIYDSTCFRELRPIKYVGSAARVAVGDPSPSPSVDGSISLPVRSSTATHLTVDVFDVTGAAVGPSRHIDVGEGASWINVDVTDVESGSYYIRVTSEAGEAAFRRVIIE